VEHKQHLLRLSASTLLLDSRVVELRIV
jgi:hypothetical protein